MKQSAKKLLVVLFSLFIAGMLFLPSFSISTSQMEQSVSNDSEVFVIDSVTKWNEFCKKVNNGQSNLDAVLTCDLEIDDENPYICSGIYNGTFYGCGYDENYYHIDFVNYCGFIFNELGEKANIKNLHLNCCVNLKDKAKVKSGICRINHGEIRDCDCDIEERKVNADNNCGICMTNNGKIIDSSFFVNYKTDDNDPDSDPNAKRNSWMQSSLIDDEDGTLANTKLSYETSDVIKPYILISLSLIVVLSLVGLWILYRRKCR